jgi:hypothetical protein
MEQAFPDPQYGFPVTRRDPAGKGFQPRATRTAEIPLGIMDPPQSAPDRIIRVREGLERRKHEKKARRTEQYDG